MSKVGESRQNDTKRSELGELPVPPGGRLAAQPTNEHSGRLAADHQGDGRPFGHPSLLWVSVLPCFFMFFEFFLMYLHHFDLVFKPLPRFRVGLPMMKVSDLVSFDLEVV